jgi:hypothetical protein
MILFSQKYDNIVFIRKSNAKKIKNKIFGKIFF